MTPEIKKRIEQIRHGGVPDGYTKIGKFYVPDSWDIQSLDKCVSFLDDKRIPLKENERKAGPYPYYGASGIIDYVENFIFDGEFILLGEDGANILERSSPLAYRVSGKCWVNNHAHVLQPSKGINIDFLTCYLENLPYERYNTGTAQPKLNQETCKRLPVILPYFAEQQKIAEILTTQNKIIELKEKRLAEKQRQKKYMMQQLFAGKIRLKGYDKKWNVRKLICIAKKEIAKNTDFRYSLVLSNSAQYGIVPQEEQFDKIIANSERINGYYIVKNGFFVYNPRISAAAPCGPINMNETQKTGIMSPLYTIFSLKGVYVDSMYMKQYFKSTCWYGYMKSVANYGARHDRMSISDEDFFAMPIPLPELDEQKNIAKILSLADHEIELLQKDIEQEKQKKKALMQLLLTGIVRVNT